jgi:hypothetical protein
MRSSGIFVRMSSGRECTCDNGRCLAVASHEFLGDRETELGIWNMEYNNARLRISALSIMFDGLLIFIFCFSPRDRGNGDDVQYEHY